MNIPIGNVEEEHLSFSESNPLNKINHLMQSGFDGYVVATIEGISGLEEGLLLLKGKEIVGAVFDALRINKQLYGVPALRLSLNLLKARKGVFDVNRLSRQQIDLIIAFNEKIRLAKPITMPMLPKLLPSKYKPDIVSKELAVDLGVSETKYKLLKRLGLGSI